MKIPHLVVMTPEEFASRSFSDVILALDCPDSAKDAIGSIVLGRAAHRPGLMDRNYAIWGLDGVTENFTSQQKSEVWNKVVADLGLTDPCDKLPWWSQFVGAWSSALNRFGKPSHKMIAYGT